MSKSLGSNVTVARVRETVRYQIDVSWSGPPGARVPTYGVVAFGVARGIDSGTGVQTIQDGPQTPIVALTDAELPAAFKTFFTNTANPFMDAQP
jgi:hypothetical protein